jgi:hypothetical protein
VIGITTLRPSAKDVVGIGFALSSSDLIRILRNFYPKENVLAANVGAQTESAQKSGAKNSDETSLAKEKTGESTSDSAATIEVGTVDILEPQGAMVRVDGYTRGYAPLSLQLSAKLHRVVVIPPDGSTWQLHLVAVVANSRVSIDTPLALRPPAN